MAKKPNFLYLFTMGMTSIYIVFGLVLIFWERAEEFLPGWKHYVLGFIMFIYAGYRVFRLKKIQQQMENEQSN